MRNKLSPGEQLAQYFNYLFKAKKEPDSAKKETVIQSIVDGIRSLMVVSLTKQIEILSSDLPIPGVSSS